MEEDHLDNVDIADHIAEAAIGVGLDVFNLGMDDHNSESDEDEDDHPSEHEFQEVDDYLTLFNYLSKEWLKVEVNHHVSKVASEAFWNLGKKWFHHLFRTKEIQGVLRKTPTFVHIRRQFYKKYVPPVQMDVAYQNKENGELTILEGTEVIPRNRFPASQFHKLWEIGHVEVKTDEMYTSLSKVLLLFIICFHQVLMSQKSPFF